MPEPARELHRQGRLAEAIAAKASTLTGFALECCDAAGLESPTPAEAERRGVHVSVRHHEARRIVESMATEHRVVADFRTPDLVRLGCAPLTTRYRDVHAGVAAIVAAAG